MHLQTTAQCAFGLHVSTGFRPGSTYNEAVVPGVRQLACIGALAGIQSASHVADKALGIAYC